MSRNDIFECLKSSQVKSTDLRISDDIRQLLGTKF